MQGLAQGCFDAVIVGKRTNQGRISALVWVWLLGLLCAPRWVQAAGIEGPAYEVAEHATPSRLCPKETRRIRIRLENTGGRAWDPAQGDRLSYHWLREDGTTHKHDGRRTDLREVVSTGDTVELSAKITAPQDAGRYRLVWRMLREGEAWFPTSEGASVDVEVRGREPALAWALTSAAAVPQLAAKAQGHMEVTVRNTGCSTWSAASEDRMSYRWFSADGRTKVADGKRTPFERDVPPGEGATVDLKLAGPPTPGRYTLRLSPVRERVGWQGDPTEGEAAFAVEVRDAAFQWSWQTVQLPEDDMASGDTVKIEVSISNTGTSAWDPDEGDRLSYHWMRDGVRVPREGRRSPLPHRVEPGQSLTTAVTVVAPDEAGTYALQIEPLRERVAWYGPPSQSNLPAGGPTIEVQPPAFVWSLLGLRAPSFPFAGHQTAYTVVVRNEGSRAWEPTDRVSYEILAPDGVTHVAHGRRTRLERRVEPGERVRLDVAFDTPRTPGHYVVRFGVLRENVRWFVGTAKPVQLHVVRRSTLWIGAVLSILLIGVVWRPSTRWQPRIDALAWPLWTLLSVALLTEIVADLTHFQLFAGREWIVLSVAAMPSVLIALLRPRAQPWLAFFVVALLALVALIDLSYAAFFGGLAPLTAVRAVHHLLDAEATVGTTLRPAFAWLLAPPLSFVLVLLASRHRAPGNARTRRRRWAVALACLLGTLPASYTLTTAVRSTLGVRVFSEAHNAQRFGYLGAHLFQALRLLRDLGAGPLNAQERAAVWASLAAHHKRTPVEGHGVAPGSNLVILQVEALQDWVVHAQIEGQPVMPFLASADRDALAFSVYDQTAQGRTSDAEYLVLGSGHALREGALSFLRADNQFRTLVHALADEGYATYSAHPYQRAFWNRSVLHPAYGFERSDFRDDLGRGPKIGWGLADGPFLQRFGERIAALPQPFVAFGITLSLHHPYESFPPRLATLEVGELQGTWVGNYLQAMRHFDDALAQWFADLDAAGLRENTVVLVYGDHVTGMDTDDVVAQLASERTTRHVDARMHRIPAFLWAGQLHGRSDLVGGQIDLGPTALHVLGIDPPMSFVGTPLLEQGPGFAAFPNGGGATEDRMLIRRGPDVPVKGLCVELPSERVRDRADCDALEVRVGDQLQLARRILDHDLYRDAEAQR